MTLDNVYERSAQAVCGALFGCCNQEDLAEYFKVYQPSPDNPNDPLKAFVDRLPPRATLDQQGCVTVMQEIFPVIWLGQWVEQARAGLVSFDPAGAEQCYAELRDAQCGKPLRLALQDERCLGKERYGNGVDTQRRMFDRTRVAGDACKPFIDGFGSVAFGSCDPTRAFCCVPDDTHPENCRSLPRPGSQGTCKAISPEGGACGSYPSFQWCAADYNCDPGLSQCVHEPDMPLAIGDPCQDGMAVLGECVNGYCSYDSTCHALKANRAPCEYPYECESGLCANNMCTVDEYCVGDTPVTVDNVVTRSAAAICSRLYGCCNDQDHVEYFKDYLPVDGSSDDPLAPFASRLPPNATLDEQGCTAIMQEILPVIWLGDWLQQVRDGLVSFDDAGAWACLNHLETAACGPTLKAALYDDRCFGKQRSSTGADGQRRMFSRTRHAGATCRSTADGFVGIVYGSCDPTAAFCCVPETSNPQRCKLTPAPGAVGLCRAVSQHGQACGVVPDVQWCATGYYCNDLGWCESDVPSTVEVGNRCMDGTNVVGECYHSYCDVLGDGYCHPLKPDGQDCTYPEECVSGGCESNVCGTPLFCTSTL